MREHSHSFFAAVRSEHKILLVGNENACNPSEVWNRTQVLVGAGIDQVDRIVRCVGDVEYSRLVVNGAVVKAAPLLMSR